MVVLQFLPQGQCLIVCQAIQKFPEAVAMVHLDRMTEFMEQYIIDQMSGEQH